MKKVYIIENVDCANCAAKIESKFNAHPRVEEAVITFATGQLRLTAEDPDALIPELTEIARTVEQGAVIRSRENAHDHHDHECGCGHHHEHDHECGCGHHHEHDHECGCGHHREHDHGCGCGHHHGHDHGCGCGHHHGHDHDCGCGHHQEDEHGHDHHHDHGEEDSPWQLVAGAVLFLAALLIRKDILVLAVCVGAYLLLGRNVIKAAVKNLTKGHVMDENFLMAVASIGAFFIGSYTEAVGVMLFYRVGEFFEHRAVERSRSQIMEAVDLRPEVVQLVDGDAVHQIPAAQAKVGDVLLVRPGDRIPLDGTVLTGESRIDTAPITGEAVPVRAAAGDSVISGCVNTVGQLTIRVDKVLEESMVTRILDSVENAAASKPRVERFITRFARVYTPVVVGIAAATAVLPSLFTGDWGYWVYTALTFLVMSCPCALVLSVPLAFFAGIGAGSKQGILFKGGQVMEAMKDVKAVVLDKTGTLTRGDFKVQKIVGGMQLLQLCANCEQYSTHPIAMSIVEAAKANNLELYGVEELEELPGMGIRAKYMGSRILCGNEKLLKEHGVTFENMEGGGTRVLVAADDRFLGLLVIDDTLKGDAEMAVRQLQAGGVEVAMLTGDGEAAARAVAGKVGIRHVHAGLLPQQKLEHLVQIREELGKVMFVGDGINDAPVLAGADVGAAMGSGADAAIEAADVVFMTSDMEAVPKALRIARDTGKVAWQNVVFALGVKLIVMILGLCGYASMWLAVFADSGVAMLCVLNSIRMLYKK